MIHMDDTNSIRGHRKERVGEVVSNKMQKTIVVRVERRFPHPKYKKVITAFSKFYAHDEKGDAKVGDKVSVRVLEVDLARRRIALTRKSGAALGPAPEQAGADQPSGRSRAPARGNDARGVGPQRNAKGGSTAKPAAQAPSGASTAKPTETFRNNPFAKHFGK